MPYKLIKIPQKTFYKSYRAHNTRHLSTHLVSKQGNINYTYCARMISPKSPCKTVTVKMVHRIGKGLGMTVAECNVWIKAMLSKDNSRHHAKSSSIKRHKLHPTIRAEDSAKVNARDIKALSATKSKRHGHKYDSQAVIFYPDRSVTPPLAEAINHIMTDKHVSIKDVTKKSFVNKKRLHKVLNGQIRTVNMVTAIRIADGLSINPQKLIKANHYNPTIKVQPLSNIVPKVASHNAPKHNNTPTIMGIVNKLKPRDQAVVQTVAERLLDLERK